MNQATATWEERAVAVVINQAAMAVAEVVTHKTKVMAI
jgi:hypothetical protein